jgi:hypothetical protein
MTLTQALAEYDRLLYRKPTREEIEAGLKALIENKETGRASGFYRPAYDPCQEDQLWP